jgi:hypothetical protein
MPLSREVDFMPGGDYAFVVVIPNARQRCQLWLYTWDQVENNRDDGRTSAPDAQASLANREMLLLAKYLLKLAGHEAHKQIDIPDQEWNLAGKEIENGYEEEDSETSR